MAMAMSLLLEADHVVLLVLLPELVAHLLQLLLPLLQRGRVVRLAPRRRRRPHPPVPLQPRRLPHRLQLRLALRTPTLLRLLQPRPHVAGRLPEGLQVRI